MNSSDDLVDMFNWSIPPSTPSHDGTLVSLEPIKETQQRSRRYPQVFIHTQGLAVLCLRDHGFTLTNGVVSVGSNFRINPEQYFWEMENVAEFLENFDNNLTHYEIPTQLTCAYLKGHLTGRALDWFEVLGYRVVEDKATDYAH
ncbi:uncharacterized protein TNCV_1936601 [Trichonephila clavipes]|nr:uncharacterized protein TNCV_1936601 [Trichonephila clavipes]